MGSQAKQAALWGNHTDDWAAIQEETCKPGFEYALSMLQLRINETLLDIGCGAGLFCRMAADAGAHVTGIDGTAGMIEQARQKSPEITFYVGEMEQLPFAGNAFDVVTGFNAFQYAESTPNALAEATRVLKQGGRLAAMIWGNREDCEAASFLKAVGSLMPPPPPGAPGPFALTENHLLEDLLVKTGLEIIDSNDVSARWDYPDKETALKGFMSSGPVTATIAFSGLEKVTQTIAESMQPYIRQNGRVIYDNKFRVITARK